MKQTTNSSPKFNMHPDLAASSPVQQCTMRHQTRSEYTVTTQHPSVAVVGLGSNLGDRLTILKSAVQALGRLGALRGISVLYESAPVGGPVQDHYLNAAVALSTPLAPRELLAQLHAIEARHGRGPEVRASEQRWGPRRLDLDLLWLETAAPAWAERPSAALALKLPGLVVPHPRLLERAFALVPLLELMPDARDPQQGAMLCEYLPQLKHQRIDLYAPAGWSAEVLPVD